MEKEGGQMCRRCNINRNRNRMEFDGAEEVEVSRK